MPRGLFFSFDGLDGTGKSTQAELFCQWLTELGHAVMTCRDPGTTALGERLRSILLETRDAELGTALPIAPRTETLLYMAARAQLVAEVIEPALLAGHTVVSDRFVLANVAYQAYGFGTGAGGLGIDARDVWQLNQFPTDGLEPDATFVMDLPVEVAAQRRGATADRMEERDLAYRQRVREGFLVEASHRPDRIFVIDGNGEVDAIQQQIRQAARKWIP